MRSYICALALGPIFFVDDDFKNLRVRSFVSLGVNESYLKSTWTEDNKGTEEDLGGMAVRFTALLRTV